MGPDAITIPPGCSERCRGCPSKRRASATNLGQRCDSSGKLAGGVGKSPGLSIAWAVAEPLASTLGARTIFATHYHELNALAQQRPNVANAQVLVEDTGNDLRFLHRVVSGGANRSYGIEAARLAGVPAAVVLRARQVLGRIEANSHVAVGLDSPGAARAARIG